VRNGVHTAEIELWQNAVVGHEMAVYDTDFWCCNSFDRVVPIRRVFVANRLISDRRDSLSFASVCC